MSYILDALKRADAQRTHGGVPGLHTRQLATPTLPAATRTGRYLWPTIAALALGTSAALWWLWPMPGNNMKPVAVDPATIKAPIIAPLAPPQPMLTAAVPTPSASASTSATLPTPPVAVSESPTVAPPPSKPKPELLARTVAAPLASAPAPTVPAPVSASQTGPATVPLLSELPEELRRQIPALVITGAVYSANPAQRLLLVNNQVLTQGSLAAPELTLEEIRAKSSVFSFRGTRFRLAH